MRSLFNWGEAYFSGAATQPEAGKPRQSLNLGISLKCRACMVLKKGKSIS